MREEAGPDRGYVFGGMNRPLRPQARHLTLFRPMMDSRRWCGTSHLGPWSLGAFPGFIASDEAAQFSFFFFFNYAGRGYYQYALGLNTLAEQHPRIHCIDS